MDQEFKLRVNPLICIFKIHNGAGLLWSRLSTEIRCLIVGTKYRVFSKIIKDWIDKLFFVIGFGQTVFELRDESRRSMKTLHDTIIKLSYKYEYYEQGSSKRNEWDECEMNVLSISIHLWIMPKTLAPAEPKCD